jgi:hypothetical protein
VKIYTDDEIRGSFGDCEAWVAWDDIADLPSVEPPAPWMGGLPYVRVDGNLNLEHLKMLVQLIEHEFPAHPV